MPLNKENKQTNTSQISRIEALTTKAVKCHTQDTNSL